VLSSWVAQGDTAVEAAIVGPVEAKVGQVWLTDGLVNDRVE
jgi:hypothetical protein